MGKDKNFLIFSPGGYKPCGQMVRGELAFRRLILIRRNINNYEKKPKNIPGQEDLRSGIRLQKREGHSTAVMFLCNVTVDGFGT